MISSEWVFDDTNSEEAIAYDMYTHVAPKASSNVGVDILERMAIYDKDHCWQYDIRLNNAKTDLEESGFTEEYIKTLRTGDFEYKIVTDKKERSELTKFIYKHEWLASLSQYTTHWFGAYHKGILAGVILMNMPNAFSKLLGDDTKHIERLISRGACISWSPKNLASNFLMWCMKYMAHNTQYRLFTCYSDPTAKEKGSIYQALNMYYIGQNSGTTKRYINPYTGRLVSDRVFRARSFYKIYAKELNIKWEKNWSSDQSMLWENVPKAVEDKLRERSKEVQASATYHTFPSKHKYVFILGKDNSETKFLRKKFLSMNKIYPYPTERGK